ncbi:MAG: hypothetical protein HY515_00945 [Candidatus Aenigmarchaeota archaeon]|nr:hypothetical protein [Candidatus Aenigmarchaeota archaeon]
MKGQFFIVATVIIVGVLLGIYQSLQNYSAVDLSEPETYSEAFTLKNIVDVSEQLGRSLQYKAQCGDTEPFDELKYFFESKASGPFAIDFNYTLGCTSSNLLKNAYYNVTLSSNRARYFASFKAARFDGLTLIGLCDSAEYGLTDVLSTKDAYKSHKIEKSCDNQPSSRFLWKKDNSYMAFKAAGANANNVDVKAYTEQINGAADTDIFAIEISSNGHDYSQCGTDATGSNTWVVGRSCSCASCTDVYARIKAKDTGAQPNILRKVELTIF